MPDVTLEYKTSEVQELVKADALKRFPDKKVKLTKPQGDGSIMVVLIDQKSQPWDR